MGARILAAASLGLFVSAAAAPAFAQGTADAYTSYTRYDAMGRVTGTISPDPDGSGTLPHLATRTFYDARGLVTKVESGYLASFEDADVDPWSWAGFTLSARAETGYDGNRRKVWEKTVGSDQLAVSLIQYSYDALGRLECTAVRMNRSDYAAIEAAAVAGTLDACTPRAAGSQGPDRITKTIYDAAGQVLQVREGVGSTIEAAEVTYSYTPNGKIKHLIDANGNKTTYDYDGFDRLVRWNFPSKAGAAGYNDATPDSALDSAGASAMPGTANPDYEEYSYDANGNRLTLRKRDGDVISYTYDALNRMTRKAFASSSVSIHWRRTVHYDYDLRGLQTAARFDNASSTEGIFTQYDGFGRIASVTDTLGGKNYTIASEHDANGNRTRITHPDGKKFGYAFDGLDRLVRIATGATGSEETLTASYYNTKGQLYYWGRAGNAINHFYGYDAVGRLRWLRLHDVQASVQAQWDFTRNPAGQIVTESRDNDQYAFPVAESSFERNYAVNGLNQYTGTTNASGSNPVAFCFDANGNLTFDGRYVYRYDVENRLMQMRAKVNDDCNNLDMTGAWKAGFAYDPLGRLYIIDEGAVAPIRLLHDGDALIAEYDNASNTLLRRYVHGPDLGADDPLVWYEGQGTTAAERRYLYADARGSIVLVADANGNKIAINAYDEYGIPTTSNDGWDISTRGRFRYTGQIWLPSLGMYHYKARVYSPVLGRFLQTDPIGYEDQFNLYAYVGNDPINGVDPTGMRDVYVGGFASSDRSAMAEYVRQQQLEYPEREIVFIEQGKGQQLRDALSGPLPEGEPLNVIAHSLGARDVLRLADNAGTSITTLTTLDPVGATGADNQAISANTGNWTNVTANPSEGSRNLSDRVASFGNGLLGRTNTQGADQNSVVVTNHGDAVGLILFSGTKSRIDETYKKEK